MILGEAHGRTHNAFFLLFLLPSEEKSGTPYLRSLTGSGAQLISIVSPKWCCPRNGVPEMVDANFPQSPRNAQHQQHRLLNPFHILARYHADSATKFVARHGGDFFSHQIALFAQAIVSIWGKCDARWDGAVRI
jgi:hypothetical protein